MPAKIALGALAAIVLSGSPASVRPFFQPSGPTLGCDELTGAWAFDDGVF